MNESRIYDRVDINLEYDDLVAFFENRAKKSDATHLLTTTMYQDLTPELAVARDNYEKNKILPMLQLSEQHYVLDVGCGIGRWCDPVIKSGAHYFGLDFSSSLINIAKERYSEKKNCKFISLPSDKLSKSILETDRFFTHSIISGLFLYLSDEQINKTIAGICECTEAGSLLYIREPVGIGCRLTLKKYWSEELGDNYNAIYRTIDELNKIFEIKLYNQGFKLQHSGNMYDSSLNNRADTEQMYFIMERR